MKNLDNTCNYCHKEIKTVGIYSKVQACIACGKSKEIKMPDNTTAKDIIRNFLTEIKNQFI